MKRTVILIFFLVFLTPALFGGSLFGNINKIIEQHRKAAKLSQKLWDPIGLFDKQKSRKSTFTRKVLGGMKANLKKNLNRDINKEKSEEKQNNDTSFILKTDTILLSDDVESIEIPVSKKKPSGVEEKVERKGIARFNRTLLKNVIDRKRYLEDKGVIRKGQK
ncbi:hypothetical protein ACFL35_05565 [Candidatus Riflebacteria bacterium]